MNIRRQKRINRVNINLTDDEAELFYQIAKFTGEPMGVILRNAAVKQALETLLDDDDLNLDAILHKGANQHLMGS